MNGEFFRTVMGSRFYEGTMPRIATNLERIHQEMKRYNDKHEPAATRWDALISLLKENDIPERKVAMAVLLLLATGPNTPALDQLREIIARWNTEDEGVTE